jgi:hypothetical protein
VIRLKREEKPKETVVTAFLQFHLNAARRCAGEGTRIDGESHPPERTDPLSPPLSGC